MGEPTPWRTAGYPGYPVIRRVTETDAAVEVVHRAKALEPMGIDVSSSSHLPSDVQAMWMGPSRVVLAPGAYAVLQSMTSGVR